MKAGDTVEYGFFDADRNTRKFRGKVMAVKSNKVIVESDAGHDVELTPQKDHIRVLNTPFTNVKKGDRVSVKGAKKYDALSPDTVAGTVLFIHPDGKVAVQVGSGQMNVLPQDIVNSSPFANGRAKAEAYLNSRAEACGVRVENSKVVHVEKNRGGFVVYVDGKEVDYASNQTELHAILRDYDSMGYRFDRTKSRF